MSDSTPGSVLLLVSLFAIAAPASAQSDTERRDPRTTVTNAGALVPFLEGTDVFFALRQDTVFEADIQPHLVAYQNFTDLIDITQQTKRQKTFAISITGTPAVRLRMFDQVSNPVRTPSYMPRGNFQVIWARNVGAVASAFAAGRTPAADAGSQVSLWEAHVTGGHHSNGQDGCFFTDEQRVGEDCIPPDPLPDQREVNKHDGSFSTNYIRVGMNYRRNTLDDQLWATREWGFRVDFEYHPRAWVDDEMEDLYGRARTEFAASIATREISWCPKRAEAMGAIKAIAGHPDSVWPVAITAQASCFPTREGGWGFFVRYYGGQDYYNLGLLDNIQRVHVGATYNQSGFFRFRRPGQGQGSGGAAQ
ncbi:MAG TPA: hypothetical protein VFV95_19080 [Vicinamibacterales bacterium]|nr:hypothetical protein [Vicinamibacterales bacterium]